MRWSGYGNAVRRCRTSSLRVAKSSGISFKTGLAAKLLTVPSEATSESDELASPRPRDVRLAALLVLGGSLVIRDPSPMVRSTDSLASVSHHSTPAGGPASLGQGVPAALNQAPGFNETVPA